MKTEALLRRVHVMRGRTPRTGLPPINSGRMRVTALVPAHNEASNIAETIASLQGQEQPPDRIIVIADNCTDDTAEIAARRDAEVVTTHDNAFRKAGALNQVLDRLLPTLGPDDVLLVMDADSALDPGFIRHGGTWLADGRYAAIGGTFTGKAGGGFVGMLQRNEYARYARDVRRLHGKVLVLTGTATLFRALTLREVVRARVDGRLPGGSRVYDVRVLTEDNELTLAILHLGMRIRAPRECTLTTEVMTTWGDLFRQRLRWKRGALENLTDYGLTRVTREYWGRQFLSLLGITVMALYLGSVLWSLTISGAVQFHPLWIAVTLIFVLERVVTVRSRGGFQMAIAGVLVVEMAFDIFLLATQAKAFWETAWKRERRW